MVNFSTVGGVLLAEGHDHVELDLRAGLTAALTDRPQLRAERDAHIADLAEAWYSDEHGFGHDCSLHDDVDRSLCAPGCHAGGFRPVTIATGVPVAGGVKRAAAAAGGRQ